MVLAPQLSSQNMIKCYTLIHWIDRRDSDMAAPVSGKPDGRDTVFCIALLWIFLIVFGLC